MELTREQQLLQKVISKAWDDASFKKELMVNPMEAIKQLTGETISIPDGKVLKVFDQSNPNHICLNIPQKPQFDNVELTDEQLEIIAGGQYLMSASFIEQKVGEISITH